MTNPPYDPGELLRELMDWRSMNLDSSGTDYLFEKISKELTYYSILKKENGVDTAGSNIAVFEAAPKEHSKAAQKLVIMCQNLIDHADEITKELGVDDEIDITIPVKISAREDSAPCISMSRLWTPKEIREVYE